MKKYIPLLVGIVLTDTLTKYWVNIADPDFSVIGNILKITHVKKYWRCLWCASPRHLLCYSTHPSRYKYLSLEVLEQDF
jgi:hypothetical protein